ncbi:uncharacterized protein LOC124161874 [Ischnura elegans]|uniref:uncharacterized protein LOC124161874 n=1 Tax=Ischnura elegans TaxID=197161 RepID=UPI001ED8B894|nr:uncharacterized protein LOC124161874 [Ischnura elegans]
MDATHLLILLSLFLWADGDLSLSGAGEGKHQSSSAEEKKSLAQQVAEGKYGLIQDLQGRRQGKTKAAPGVLSYASNAEVPTDTEESLGGLSAEEIWLAEDHLLVLRGGGFKGSRGGGAKWAPIDDFKAPPRPIKIPQRPKVPPPFPVQLRDGEPPRIIGGALPPLPPPPPNNPDDEDDPSLYYPPPYDFKYEGGGAKERGAVGPGPLVPGIVLPPPPHLFAPLRTTKPNTTTTTPRPSTTTPRPSTTTTSTPGPSYLPPSNEVARGPTPLRVVYVFAEEDAKGPTALYQEYFEARGQGATASRLGAFSAPPQHDRGRQLWRDAKPESEKNGHWQVASSPDRDHHYGDLRSGKIVTSTLAPPLQQQYYEGAIKSGGHYHRPGAALRSGIVNATGRPPPRQQHYYALEGVLRFGISTTTARPAQQHYYAPGGADLRGGIRTSRPPLRQQYYALEGDLRGGISTTARPPQDDGYYRPRGGAAAWIRPLADDHYDGAITSGITTATPPQQQYYALEGDLRGGIGSTTARPPQQHYYALEGDLRGGISSTTARPSQQKQQYYALDGDLRSGIRSTTARPPQQQHQQYYALEGDLRGGISSTTARPPQKLQQQYYALEGDLRGGISSTTARPPQQQQQQYYALDGDLRSGIRSTTARPPQQQHQQYYALEGDLRGDISSTTARPAEDVYYGAIGSPQDEYYYAVGRAPTQDKHQYYEGGSATGAVVSYRLPGADGRGQASHYYFLTPVYATSNDKGQRAWVGSAFSK